MIENEELISQARELARVLDDVRYYSRKLERKEANALSTYVLVYYQLTKHYLHEKHDNVSIVKSFKQRCTRYIENFVGRQEFAAAGLALAMDPRFVRPKKGLHKEVPEGMKSSLSEIRDWVKSLGFEDNLLEKVARVYWQEKLDLREKLPSKMNRIDLTIFKQHRTSATTTDTHGSNNKEDDSSVNSGSDEELSSFPQEVLNELKQFRTSAREDLQEPLPFWKKYASARKFMAIPGSAAPAEPVFSIAERVHSGNSCSGTADTLTSILTLKNVWLGWMDLSENMPSDAFDVNSECFGENEEELSGDVDGPTEDEIKDDEGEATIEEV